MFSNWALRSGWRPIDFFFRAVRRPSLSFRNPRRIVRRLVLERRIAYIKVGRHVRIAEVDLAGFVAAGRIEASA